MKKFICFIIICLGLISSCTPEQLCDTSAQLRPDTKRYFEIAIVLNQNSSDYGTLDEQRQILLEALEDVYYVYIATFNIEFKVVAIITSDLVINDLSDWGTLSLQANEYLNDNYPCLNFDASILAGSSTLGGGEAFGTNGECGNHIHAGAHFFANTLAHEIGHLLGADDASCNCDNVMCPNGGTSLGYVYASQSQIVNYIQKATCLDNEPDWQYIEFPITAWNPAHDFSDNINIPEIIDVDEVKCTGAEFTFSLPSGFEGTWEFNSTDIIPTTDPNILSTSITASTLIAGNYVARAQIVGNNGCNPATIEIEFEVKETIEGCSVHPNPPVEFDVICMDFQEVCYDFSYLPCVDSLVAISSSPKLIPEVNGGELCLTSIHPSFEQVILEVTPVLECGDGVPQFWNLKVNDPDYCNDDGGF